MLGMTHNIDTIIVNPSEEERVRAAFLVNGYVIEQESLGGEEGRR